MWREAYMQNPKDGRSKNVPNGGNGRPKGTPNKNTREIKDMILKALEGAGGVEYLIERAHDPRTASAFLGLVGKVLPLQVKGDFTSSDGSMTPTTIVIRAAAPSDDSGND